MTRSTVLSMSHVVKTYPGVRALDDVSFEVVEGEVHALLGENGAGKSTLISVAVGSLQPDSGGVEIGGQSLDQAQPMLAQSLGLAVVYQHTSVLDDLTVSENLVYAVPRQRRATKLADRDWVVQQLRSAGAVFDPATRVNALNAAQRQQLEIAKALASSPKVLILDEPTEALTETESEQLFERIRQITAAGTAVVYISHRLPEVTRIADRITVLRDGQTRGTFAAHGRSEREILNLIIGRPIDQTFPPKADDLSSSEVVLSASHITGTGVRGVDLEVRAGEIVGLAGVEGNGQREFLRGLVGLGDVTGSVIVRGHQVNIADASHAYAGGIVYLPGDRQTEGLFLDLSVAANISTLTLDRLAHGGFVSAAKEDALVSSQITNLAIKTRDPDVAVSTLSGGNQQKVLFARSLAKDPAVLLADEPTRGVDAGARLELYRVLRRAAESGSAVIVLSSDALELQGLADRVLVFSRGQVARTLVGEEITEDNITSTALTAAGSHRGQTDDGRPVGRDTQSQRLKRFVSGDYAPTLILTLLIVALGLYTGNHSPRFLSDLNLQGTLFLASALAFTSFGQLIVLLTAGVDLSVGPTMGLVVVVVSFYAGDAQTNVDLLLGFLAVIGTAVAIGSINGTLIRLIGLTPVITTISMYIALQGVSLVLRPTPDGFLRIDFMDAFQRSIGPIPVVFIVAVVVSVVAEAVLRRTRFGIGIRAVGSNEETAHRLGARSSVLILSAYVLCAVFSAVGGVLLAAQVGVGDGSVGTNYTLSSITAVVLGGASIFGGRGSFIGALAGVILIQEVSSATGFLGLGPAWQYALPGVLILIAAISYSRARSGDSHNSLFTRWGRRLQSA